MSVADGGVMMMLSGLPLLLTGLITKNTACLMYCYTNVLYGNLLILLSKLM